MMIGMAADMTSESAVNRLGDIRIVAPAHWVVLAGDGPDDLVRHASYVKYTEYSRRNISALERDLAAGTYRVSTNCGPELLARIIDSAVRDARAPTRLREVLGAPRVPRRLV